GLIPALKTSHPDVIARIKEGGRSLSRTNHGAQNAFVVAEMAMALILLIGAGLMIRSLARLWKLDPGFDPHHVLTFSISLPPTMNRANPDAVRAAFRELDRKLASVPEVQAASITWGSVPLLTDDEVLFWMAGQPKPSSPNDMNWALSYMVGPGYLRTMGIPILRGRFFAIRDDEHSPPGRCR